jgi:hypothetical protein
MMEEKLPVSEKLLVLKSETIYKTHKWWCAVALVEAFGKKQVMLYLWLNKENQWKRKEKFVLHYKKEWQDVKERIEKLIDELK